MLTRLAIAVVLTGLLIVNAAPGARAQQPTSFGQQTATTSGWIFNVSPYLWMPTIQVASKFNLPPALGGTVSSDTSLGFGQILSHINSGLMVAGDARYDRFSVLTDFLYLNLGGAATHFTTVDFFGLPRIPISTAVQTHAGLNLNAKIWTLAGGYTLLQGDWGNFDAIAGFRFLGIPATIDYNLALTITGPRGNGATFGGRGSVSGTADLWNGIGGFRGRVRLADTGFFIPYYFDAGAGGSQFTWQIASGVGYHATRVDVSLTWRYLSFEQKSSAVLQHLSINGPMLAATFTF
jgi:hypothetical protein